MSKFCDDLAKLLTKSKKNKSKEVLIGETNTANEYIYSKWTILDCERESMVIVAQSGDSNYGVPKETDNRSHEIIFESA